jgi:hypothetical protein
MKQVKVILNIRDGLVQNAFSSDPEMELMQVSWDTEGSDPSEDGVVEVQYENGNSSLSFVHRPTVYPMDTMAGTDVDMAIETAGDSR